MKRFFPFLVSLTLLLSFTFCGKKGPLLPPLPRMIKKIEAFEITQRGEKIILEWENPAAYADGSPLSEIAEVEIWLVEKGRESAEAEKAAGEKKQLSLGEFEKSAKLIASIKQEELSEHHIKKEDGSLRLCYSYKFTRGDVVVKKLTFGLRVIGKKKRKSAFSKLLAIEPRILSLPPQGLKATVFKDRIEIRWSPAEKNIDQSSPAHYKGFNVYRAEEEGLFHRLNSQLIKERKFDDKDIFIGRVYRYFIRASATDAYPFSESDDSEVVKILTQDTFAPAAPAGLVSIVAGDYISLSWDVNQEEDLAGYRVWRKTEGEDEYILLTAQPIRENAFNDTTVEKNKRYYYAITAQDRFGNESPKSESASEIIRDEFS